MRIKLILSLFTVLTLVIPAVTVNAQVIFSEDFSGTSADINGTTPDVTTGGAAWVATSVFNQDGSINPGAGSMTLAFTPVNGVIYTLDASLTGVTGNNDWFGLGFVQGQSIASGTGNRFITGDTTGKAWMLFRGAASSQYPNKIHVNGTADPQDWTAYADLTGNVDMRIVLDTTGGSGSWAATWYAKTPADSDYTQVYPAYVLPNQVIDSVGMALANSGVNGTIASFSLTDNLNLTNPVVNAGSDWITWSGEPVTPDDVEVTNNDPDAGDLTLLWSHDNPSGITVDIPATDLDIPNPTVTITKDATATNPAIVTLTLNVIQPGKDPVTDTMQIDVYDTACDAGQAVGMVTLDSGDFNADCITDFEDLAVMAATWLENYQADGPVEK